MRKKPAPIRVPILKFALRCPSQAIVVPIPLTPRTRSAAAAARPQPVVLDVRGESGSAFTTREARPVGVSDRVASVVIAIAAGDEVRFADRIATSTFVLALASAR